MKGFISLFVPQQEIIVPDQVCIENGKWTVHGKLVDSRMTWAELTMLDEKITGR